MRKFLTRGRSSCRSLASSCCGVLTSTLHHPEGREVCKLASEFVVCTSPGFDRPVGSQSCVVRTRHTPESSSTPSGLYISQRKSLFGRWHCINNCPSKHIDNQLGSWSKRWHVVLLTEMCSFANDGRGEDNGNVWIDPTSSADKPRVEVAKWCLTMRDYVQRRRFPSMVLWQVLCSLPFTTLARKTCKLLDGCCPGTSSGCWWREPCYPNS